MVYLGIDENANEVYTDNLLLESNVLITGVVGSGKSYILKRLINSFYDFNVDAEFVFCSKHIMTFEEYINKPSFSTNTANYVNSEDSMIDFLENILLKTEKDKRYKLLEKYNCKNIAEFNNRVRNKILFNSNDMIRKKYFSHLFIVIDDFFYEDSQKLSNMNDEKLEKIVRLIELAMKESNNIGYHFIIVADGMNKKLFTKEILDNSLLRICTGYGIKDGYTLDEEKNFFGKNIFLPQTYQGWGVVYKKGKISCVNLTTKQEPSTNSNCFSLKFIKEIEVRKLFGYHSYKLNFNHNNPVSIVFGTNGMGKTTIFKLLENILVLDNPSENYYKIKYILEEVVFESFKIIFSDNSSIELIKDFEKLRIIYNDEIIENKNIEIEINEPQDCNKKIEYYNKIKIHFDNINKIFPKINNENRFLFVKTGRLTNSLTIAQNLQKEFNINKEKIESEMRNLYLIAHKFDNYSVIPFVEDFQKLIINKSNLLVNIYNFLKNNEYVEPEIIDVPKEIFNSFMNICTSGLCNQAFRDMKLQEGELFYYDAQDFWNDIYDEFIDMFNDYIDFYKDYLLFKEYFESFYNEYNPSFKKICIDNECRCCVKDSNEVILPFDCLSSGEKNIAIVLYDFIFKTKEGTITLIDEPEISLHISWQQQFCEVITELIKDKKDVQIIIASHSPFISSGHSEYLVSAELIREDE